MRPLGVLSAPPLLPLLPTSDIFCRRFRAPSAVRHLDNGRVGRKKEREYESACSQGTEGRKESRWHFYGQIPALIARSR